MAVTINFYDEFILNIGQGDIDLDTDTFKIVLLNSSHVFTQANTTLANITANQLATANGYTQDTKALTSVTWTQSAGTATFDAADTSWTASGGSIAADDAAIYDDTATAPVDALMCSIDFGGTQTAGDGTNFVITYNASGIFTIA